MAKLAIIRCSGAIRSTTEAEILDCLTDSELKLPREFFVFDASSFSDSYEGGNWAPVESYLHDFVQEFKNKIDGFDDPRILLFGLEEVATLIAISALIGDERPMECRDFDRESGKFQWSNDSELVSFRVDGVPQDVMPALGSVVLRIELSYRISEADVDDIIPPESRIADITIRPSVDNPRVGLLRSSDDVQAFRYSVRAALAAVDSMRPNAQIIHLFIAAPVSACIACGQELRLRNGRPVQTYRFRAAASPKMQEAIFLTPASAESVADIPLSDDEISLAEVARNHWRDALEELKLSANCLREGAGSLNTGWPNYLPSAMLQSYEGPRDLPPIWELVSAGDTVAGLRGTEFFFDAGQRTWNFDPQMMLLMSKAAGGDELKLKRLAKAFFWHEYLHNYQNVTQSTSRDIGSFANCLERIDFLADMYGVIHQVTDNLPESGCGYNEIKLITQSIGEALESFWTFEPAAPTQRWQQRRVRRYMNWYWKREQISRCSDFGIAVALLCRQPTIELAGVRVLADGRRITLDMSRAVTDRPLEIAVVSESNKLIRRSTGPSLAIEQLLKGFVTHDHEMLQAFFSALYDSANS